MNQKEIKYVNYALDKFKKAFLKLKDGANKASDELGEDGVIQRFEFTYELLWKTLKIFLRAKGVQAQTPRDVLKEAFKLEWLENEENFLNMMEDRNKTSHIYDETTSREIFKRIKSSYIPAIEKLLKKLASIFA